MFCKVIIISRNNCKKIENRVAYIPRLEYNRIAIEYERI